MGSSFSGGLSGLYHAGKISTGVRASVPQTGAKNILDLSSKKKLFSLFTTNQQSVLMIVLLFFVSLECLTICPNENRSEPMELWE